MDQKHKPTEPRTVCCIGDIHGHITKLQSLWSNLQAQIGPSDFHSALIIFLGDYCDRGNNTAQVLDFLISLPSKYPQQTHVFLSGNHDLAFAGFVGALPAPAGGAHFSDTWSEYEGNEEREGWYKELEYERMHVQSRRWAGKMSGLGPVSKSEYKGSIYDAGPTFESYGVPHGSPGMLLLVHFLVSGFGLFFCCFFDFVRSDMFDLGFLYFLG